MDIRHHIFHSLDQSHLKKLAVFTLYSPANNKGIKIGTALKVISKLGSCPANHVLEIIMIKLKEVENASKYLQSGSRWHPKLGIGFITSLFSGPAICFFCNKLAVLDPLSPLSIPCILLEEDLFPAARAVITHRTIPNQKIIELCNSFLMWLE